MQAPPLTLGLLFRVAAAVCFAVGLLLALGAFSGGNQTAWVDGGFLSLTLSFIVP